MDENLLPLIAILREQKEMKIIDKRLPTSYL